MFSLYTDTPILAKIPGGLLYFLNLKRLWLYTKNMTKYR